MHVENFYTQNFRVEWMYDYQGMVILAANQVWWTWEVEDVFKKVKKGDKMAMKNYSKRLHSQIGDLVVKVLSMHMHVCAYFILFLHAGSISANKK